MAKRASPSKFKATAKRASPIKFKSTAKKASPIKFKATAKKASPIEVIMSTGKEMDKSYARSTLKNRKYYKPPKPISRDSLRFESNIQDVESGSDDDDAEQYVGMKKPPNLRKKELSTRKRHSGRGVADDGVVYALGESSDESSGKRNKCSTNYKGKTIAASSESDDDAEVADVRRVETASGRRTKQQNHSVKKKGKQVAINLDSELVTEDSEHDNATLFRKASCSGVKKRKPVRANIVPAKKAKVLRGSRLNNSGPVVRDGVKARRKKHQEGMITDAQDGTENESDAGTDDIADTDDSENDDMLRGKQKQIRGKGRFKGLVFRGSPMRLTEVLKDLSPEQRDAVKDIGLESILDFQVDIVPSKLAYFVVNSYFPEYKYFKILGGKFTIKAKDVNNVFGLAMGGRTIVDRSKSNSANNLVKEWKSMFPEAKENHVTVTMLTNKIRGLNGEASYWFKIHFLVLFYTSLVKCHKNSYCNSSILHNIDGVDDIKELNWCDFIIHVLGGSVQDWIKKSKSTNFTGPLVFLTALYMDRVKDRKVRYERRWPVITGLTSEMMKEREKSEILQGEFGLGAILERNNKVIPKNRVYKDCELQAQDEAEAQNDRGFNIENATDSELLVMFNKLADKMELAKKDYEECYVKASCAATIQKDVGTRHAEMIIKMKFTEQFETPRTTKTPCVIETNDDPWTSFDITDEDLDNVIQMATRAATVPSTPANQPSGDVAMVGGSVVSAPVQQFIGNVEINSAGNNLNKCGQSVDEMVQEEVLAQEVTVPMETGPISIEVATMNVAAERHKTPEHHHVQLKQHAHCVFALPVMETPILEPGPSSMIVPYNPATQRIQRARRPGRAVSSPFDGTKTNLDRKIDSKEETTVKYIMGPKISDDNPCLFSWKQYAASLEHFKTLALGYFISREVVDAWSIILNNQERNKMLGQPNRLFATLLCTIFKVDNTLPENERLESFSECMNELLVHVDFLNIKDVRLTFFPMLYNDHYFLVVFDLHNNTIDVLDNNGFEKDIAENYGPTIFNLRDNYHWYLKSIGHDKADSFETMTINRVCVPWCTYEEDTNCGLFMMRYMETYYGGGMRGLNTGLNTSPPQLRRQLIKLRKLYMLEILKWAHNDNRVEINKQTALYVKSQREKKNKGKKSFFW